MAARLDDLPDDDPLPRAADAAKARLGQTPRRSQLLACVAMREGLAVELATGEGKSLALALAAACLALEGRRTHVLYPNEHLAARDAARFHPLFEELGLETGFVGTGHTRRARRRAHGADVVYVAARELAFDLLRDDLRREPARRVCRPPDAALLDEIDAPLIDDAVMPLVLAEDTSPEAGPLVIGAREVAGRLQEELHFRVSGGRSLQLTEEGEELADRLARELGLSEAGLLVTTAFPLRQSIRRALEARALWRKDEHYVVEGDAVVLLDRATGRRAPRRRLAGGLHAAIEAKERVPIRAEPRPRAMTSYLGLLERFDLVAGTSATLAEEAELLEELHSLALVVVPSEVAERRVDHPERFHRSDREKRRAMVERVRELHAAGRPVLVVAPTDGDAAALHRPLRTLGARLLASSDEPRERDLVATAGASGAITIATRLVGRGTDIRLGTSPDEAERLGKLGGLAVVIGARLEDPRLDRQLRGRAGRQGDRGSSELHSCPDDPIPRRHLEPDERRLLREGSEEDARALLDRAQDRAAARLSDGRRLRARMDRLTETQSRGHLELRHAVLEGIHPAVTTPHPPIHRAIRGPLRRFLEASRVPGHATPPPRRLARDLYRFTGARVPLTDLRTEDWERRVHRAVGLSLSARRHRLQTMATETQWAAARTRLRAEGPRRLLLAFQRIHLAELDAAWSEHLLVVGDLQATVAFRALLRGDPVASMHRDAHQAYLDMLERVETRVVERVLALPPIDRSVLASLGVG